jgi:hypothetical protein
MMDWIGWIIAPLVFTMIVERAEAISRWLINRAADALDEPSFREEWLADLEAVEGQVWKLWHGLGIIARCFPALAVKLRRGDRFARERDYPRELRRLRQKFSPEMWRSLLNAAEFEADAYHWVKPEYRTEYIERYVVEHGLGVREAMKELKRMDRSGLGCRRRLILRSRRRRSLSALKGRKGKD